MNRREFLKMAMAAAAAAHIPDFTETEAEAAYEALVERGIESYGNGWYRVWMTVEDDVVVSTFAKAGSKSHIGLQHGRVRAYFDLETGTIGSVTVDEQHEGMRQGNISISADDAYVWGTQLEKKA